MKNRNNIFRKIRKTVLLLGMAGLLLYRGEPQAQNVGITDASSLTPNYLLHLYKNTGAATSLFQLTNIVSGSGVLDGLTFDIDGSFNLSLNNREATSLGFNTSATQRMVIVSDGRVGINVTPSVNTQKLQVNGAATVEAILGYYDAVRYGIMGAANSGVFGTSNQTSGAGVFGDGSTVTDGIYGQTNVAGSNGYCGVSGLNSNATGIGVYGYGAGIYATYTDGAGVVGNGTVGVWGSNTSGIYGYLGSNIDGVVGISNAGTGTGVWGQNTNANGDGLYGINNAAVGSGTGSGIQGYTNQGGNGTIQTAGVWGVVNNASPLSGCGIGGYVGASGTAAGFNKAGVSGIAGSTVSAGFGVIGGCNNATGVGVQGQSTGSSGTGVIGIISASNQDAVYGQVSAGGLANSAGVNANNLSTVGGAVSVFGLYGSCSGTAASSGTQHLAVFGGASGASYNCAGYFNGGGETVISNVAAVGGANLPRSWGGSLFTKCNTATATGGRIYWSTGGYNFYVNSTASADYSEFFMTADSSLGVGEVVAIDPDNANNVRRARPKDRSQIVGVVSIGGTRYNDDNNGNRQEDPDYINVGLLGQVPVLVTTENGNIKPGDALTLSTKFRGRAVKATGSCRIIGYALTHFPYVDGEKNYETDILGGSLLQLQADHVMCYLSVGWYEPADSLGDGVEPASVETQHSMLKRINTTIFSPQQEEMIIRETQLKKAFETKNISSYKIIKETAVSNSSGILKIADTKSQNLEIKKIQITKEY